MRLMGSRATATDARAFPRRRAPWAVAFAVAGIGAAVLVGAGQSDAQYDYPEYPGAQPPTTTYPGTTPTIPSPLPGSSPSPGPTTTTPPSTPLPTPRRTRNGVVIKGTSIANYRFSPRTLRVRRGKRVTWTWNSNAPHNVVFRRPRKRSRTAARGRFTLRFRRRGTYRYVCTVHDFAGRIVVR